jgi:hypothetical protein
MGTLGPRPAPRKTSDVPERLRSVTAAQPGRSPVPDRFRSVTWPAPAPSKDKRAKKNTR